jgi:hypothetical protein
MTIAKAQLGGIGDCEWMETSKDRGEKFPVLSLPLLNHYTNLSRVAELGSNLIDKEVVKAAEEKVFERKEGLKYVD